MDDDTVAMRHGDRSVDMARAPWRGGSGGVGAHRAGRPVAADACRCAAGQFAGDAAVDGGGGARRVCAVRHQHDAARRRPGGDIRRADCQLVLADAEHLPLLDGLDLGGATVIDVDGPAYRDAVASAEPLVPHREVEGVDPVVMLFTSGTSGDPKAVRFAHAMAVLCGASLAERFELTADDVCYLSMPLFHSNGVAAGWAVAIACGATMVPAKFSPSRFLPDIRRYGATYMNYVGKPLALVLAHTREARRRRQHAAGGVRQRGHRTRHRRVRAAVRLPGGRQLRLQRVRRRRDARGRLPAGVDRQGLSGCQRLPPRHRDRMCDSGFRRARRAGQLRRRGRRAGQHLRRRAASPATTTTRRHRRADAARHVLVGRPGLPRRRRLDLPRRAHRRLDAGRRGEPRGGPDRADPATAAGDQPLSPCTRCPTSVSAIR